MLRPYHSCKNSIVRANSVQHYETFQKNTSGSLGALGGMFIVLLKGMTSREPSRHFKRGIAVAILLSCSIFDTSAYAAATTIAAAIPAVIPDAVNSADADVEGDFFDNNGLFVMKQVSDRLLSQLKLLPEHAFPALPNGWTKERIEHVVANIQFTPNERKIRARRSLMLDHDEKTETISALEPFFTVYGLLPDGQELSRDQLKDIERKVLREIAALWKSNEKQADKFATGVLNLFDRDIVFCKGEIKMSSTISYRFIVSRAWREGGILVTPPLWAISPEMPSYKDMQVRGINSDLFKSLISDGAGENPIVGIEKSSESSDAIKINFKLTKIDYKTESGKGEFIDIDGKSHPVECQNILTDSTATLAETPATHQSTLVEPPAAEPGHQAPTPAGEAPMKIPLASTAAR
jgi:hypothetical protein